MNRFVRWLTILAVTVAALGVAVGGTPPSASAQGAWTAQVWNNRDFAGAAVWTGTTGAVNFTWGQGPPVINGVTTTGLTDNFSARFTTSAFFSAGTYRFTVTVDDGARLYVDGALVINDWREAAQRTLQAEHTFTTDGAHTIVVEMFDALYDATIQASWALTSGGGTTPGTGGGSLWYADYFNGPDLAGPVIFSTSYPASGLNLNWGIAAPGGPVPADNFSARFLRYLTVPNDLPEGIYTFYAYADDAFRFYVDGTLILDRWDTLATERAQAEVTLLNGPHTLRFEYRELTQNAYLFLTWTPPAAQNPVLSVDAGTASIQPNVCPGGRSGVPGSPNAPAGWPPAESPTAICMDNSWSNSQNAQGTCSSHGGVRYWCLGMITGGGAPAPAPTGLNATVNASRLNVRSAPSIGDNILTTIARGQSFPATGRTGDNAWIQLTVNGQGGWSSAQYLSLSGDINALPVVDGQGGGPAPAPPQPTGVRGQVLTNLRLRAEPTTRSPQVSVLRWGETVDIVGRSANHAWYQIVRADGQTGWAFATWIRIIEGSFDALPYTDGSQPVTAPPPTEGIIAQAYGNMRIRSGPGLQYDQISKAQWGTRVQVLGISPDGQWLKVRHGDVIGWSSAPWYRFVQGSLTDVPVTSE